MNLSDIRNSLVSKPEELKPSVFKTVESYAGQLSDADEFIKKMPAVFVQLEGADYSQYSRNTYEVSITYQIWIFTNVKRNMDRKILSVENMIETVTDKIREIDNVILQSVREAYVDKDIIAYEVTIDYEPEEVV